MSGIIGWDSLGVPDFSILTRKSNHAACPVIGSEFAQRNPSPLGGNNSWIRWLSKKPFVASEASLSKAHAPLRLPIAFHVQTVLGALLDADALLLPDRTWTELGGVSIAIAEEAWGEVLS